ncbi:amino acid aminotransferase [Reinekea sp.]|jgi:aspartate/tyrosine/aromatic aminotransferase|uniref:amino acid aminotransferase n=2 Tax=Reinekea sp. TaxID=1970455 RepID=UPI003989CD25
MFERVVAAPADPILGLNDSFLKDERTTKVNLGVGVFKDEDGLTPILATVKEAERRLIEQETTKSYLAIGGDVEYGKQVQTLLFGEQHPIVVDHLARTAQTPGGTGALRIAADFMASQLNVNKIWISNPTWANHNSVFNSAGLETQAYRYYDAASHGLDFAGMLADIGQAEAGDAVLLHGCCHNPTGIDPTLEQWQQLAALAAERGFVVLFDFAYQGFAKGIDEDAAGLRAFTNVVPELLVASSFSKNFGLYNERVGAFTLVGSNNDVAETAFSQVKTIIRSNYSNPPAHGAKVVAAVLTDPELRAKWIEEVAYMRTHIHALRGKFVTALQNLGVDQDFSFIESQNGMFSFSGLTVEQVAKLKAEYGIYIVGSGRINVAGLSDKNMIYVCESIAAVL